MNTAVKYYPSVFDLIHHSSFWSSPKSDYWIVTGVIGFGLTPEWFGVSPSVVRFMGYRFHFFFLIDDTLQRSSALTRNTVSHQFIHFWWKICSLHCNWHLCHCVNGEGVFSLLLLLLLLLVSFNVDGATATDGSGWAESIWFQCESHWWSKQLSGVFWWGHIFHLIIVSDVGLDRDNHQDRAD